ncbi:hypothetical protein FOZ61_009679, partial [Perkinsus olseni]
LQSRGASRPATAAVASMAEEEDAQRGGRDGGMPTAKSNSGWICRRERQGVLPEIGPTYGYFGLPPGSACMMLGSSKGELGPALPTTCPSYCDGHDDDGDGDDGGGGEDDGGDDDEDDGGDDGGDSASSTDVHRREGIDAGEKPYEVRQGDSIMTRLR